MSVELIDCPHCAFPLDHDESIHFGDLGYCPKCGQYFDELDVRNFPDAGDDDDADDGDDGDDDGEDCGNCGYVYQFEFDSYCPACGHFPEEEMCDISPADCDHEWEEEWCCLCGQDKPLWNDDIW